MVKNFNVEPNDDSERMMIGLRLKALRQSKKITQRVAAESIGLPASSLSSLERGRTYPSLKRAGLLCAYYDAPIDFLLTGKGLNRTLNTKLGTMVQRRN